MGGYSKFDSVRIKFGIHRGHHGTIVHCGGDDGSYYAIKLDCHDEPIGYSEYELELVRQRSAKALWKQDASADCGGCYVPTEVAVCPECASELAARCIEYELETGRPVATGIEFDCMNDLRDGKYNHRWHQSDWQPVRDKVAKWCNARCDYGK